MYKLLDGIRLFVNAVVDCCIKQRSGGCQGTAAAAEASFLEAVAHRLEYLKLVSIRLVTQKCSMLYVEASSRQKNACKMW